MAGVSQFSDYSLEAAANHSGKQGHSLPELRMFERAELRTFFVRLC